MTLSKEGRYVYCYECGSRQEVNGVCKICGHADNPLLAFTVPNVVGVTKTTAIKRLTGPEAQLTLGEETSENSETVPINKVISSNPAAGTKLTKGAAVNIVVSLGPST